MHSRLKQILTEKEREIEALKREGLPRNTPELPGPRDFMSAISAPGGINLIAEIKFASPSAGTIREVTDPIDIARMYEQAGASAISLLTDRKFFKGNLEWLPTVKQAVNIPILRKDFLVDPIQVEESALYGADAILLIARILTRERLREMLSLCQQFNMAALTEVHDMNDLEISLDAGADIIGINNRDLDTFEISLDNTLELAPHVPEERVLVSESGIFGEREIQSLKPLGINAVLVGSAIMQSSNPAGRIREIIDAGRNGA